MSRLESSTLRIGQVAPDLTLPGLGGGVVRLQALLDLSNVLLVFAPGTWSPGTRSQIDQLATTCDLFRSINITVVLVLAQDAARARRSFADSDNSLLVLVDPTRQAVRDYGVYRAISRDGIGVCRPAVFLVERTGIIRFTYVGANDNDLVDVESLLLLTSWLVPSPLTVSAAKLGIDEPLSPTMPMIAVGEAANGEAGDDADAATSKNVEGDSQPDDSGPPSNGMPELPIAAS